MTRRRLRIALAVVLLAVCSAFGAVRIHERAGIVDIRAVRKLPPLTEGNADVRRIQPRDVPVRGVARQLDFSPTGDTLCPLNSISDRDPTLVLPDTAVIGEELWACVSGFLGSDAVELTMRAPGGLRRSWRVALSDGLGYREIDPMPHDPLGRYSFTARRGRLRDDASVVVTISAQTFMRLRAHRDGVQLVVGGSLAHQSVPVLLYRAWGHRAVAELRRDYYATLNIATDERGTGVLEIVPDRGTTYTCYVARLAEAATEVDNKEFCFGRP